MISIIRMHWHIGIALLNDFFIFYHNQLFVFEDQILVFLAPRAVHHEHNFMLRVGKRIKNLRFGKWFVPHGEEIAKREISLFGRLDMNLSIRVMRVERMHAGKRDARLRGNLLLRAVYENLELRMNMESGERVGGAAQSKRPCAHIRT